MDITRLSLLAVTPVTVSCDVLPRIADQSRGWREVVGTGALEEKTGERRIRPHEQIKRSKVLNVSTTLWSSLVGKADQVGDGRVWLCCHRKVISVT
jgi:hypothetical protein